MNKQVLDAIVQLLALAANLDGFNESEFEIVQKFLKEHLSEERSKEYIAIFNTLIQKQEPDPATAGEQLCRELNRELGLRQKLIILLRLLEVVYADSTCTPDEEQFMLIVSNTFNIEREKYEALKEFAGSPSAANLSENPNILLIAANDYQHNPATRFLGRDGLNHPLLVLRVRDAEMYFVRLFEITNDLFLNSESLRPGHIYAFSAGSVIKGPNLDPVYYSEVVSRFLSEGSAKHITFEGKNINLTFKGGKPGLQQVNVREESGRLVALMGGSGAGKSTLLNVLNGNITPQEGEVLINGINLHKEEEQLRGVIGYVPQDDLLMEELTVSQNLLFASRLCFSNYTEEQHEKLVSRTLANLGLYEVRNLKVGSVLQKTISGGQRKRLNIGLELLREPSVMFVDEPTSGLSSRDSENIMDLLRELTLSGKLIFVVIHQPSSELFKMFDRLIILDKGGLQIYYGNPIEAITYFKTLDDQINKEHGACELCGNVNPEEIFNIIEHKVVDEFGMPTDIRKTLPETWHRYFLEHYTVPEVAPDRSQPDNSLSIPNKLKQFFIFTARDLMAKAHNTQYLAINLTQAPILALLLAYILRYDKIDELTSREDYLFSENMNVPSYIFISVIISLFMGLVVAAEEIIKDAKILKREAFLNLSRSSYLFSKISVLFGFSLVQTVMYVLIGNYVIGIQGLNFPYWAVLFSCSCFANMLGLNVSATFNSAITIYILIPILLIPQLVLGGVTVKFDEINPHLANPGKVPVIGELMASRWAFEALCVQQYKENAYEKPLYNYDRAIENARYKSNYFVSALQTKTSDCAALLNTPAQASNPVLIKNLSLLRREIEAENKENDQVRFENTALLSPEAYTPAIARQLESYLENLHTYYIKLGNQERKQRDNYVSSTYTTDTLKAAYEKLRVENNNERLAMLVADSKYGTQIIEYKGRLIRNYMPVYFPPAASGALDFRAQLFAPCKQFFGRYWNTFGFNICVIWLMSGLLYVTLYFKTFRKILRIRG